jgi:sugar lactone lactonase YvrE
VSVRVVAISAIVLVLVGGLFMLIAWRSPSLRAELTYQRDRLELSREPSTENAEANPLTAHLNDPSGICVDPSGRIFFSVRRDHVIQVIVANEMRRYAGTGERGYTGDGKLARFARLDHPEGLAADAEGNLYVADSANHRIRRISTDGTITTVAGTGEAGFAGDGGAATRAALNLPNDVAITASGELLIADRANHRIRKVSTNGTISTIAGTGRAGFSGDGGPAELAVLNEPYGIDVDSQDRVVVADSSNHRIRRIEADGTIVTIAGSGIAGFEGNDGPALSARFDSPQEVFVLPNGEIVIGDEHNNVIRKLTTTGLIVGVAGTGVDGLCGDGGPAAEACLWDPEAVFVDARGRIFVADGDNHRIRRIDERGTIDTIAGSGPIGKR